MVNETANTLPAAAGAPTVPVGANVVVQSLLVRTDTPQGSELGNCFKTRPQSVTVCGPAATSPETVIMYVSNDGTPMTGLGI